MEEEQEEEEEEEEEEVVEHTIKIEIETERSVEIFYKSKLGSVNNDPKVKSFRSIVW